jgi:hypothetical protein
MAGTKKATKDLQTKTTSVKGGKLAVNDNLTLWRAAKPGKKDLPVNKDVKGGAGGTGGTGGSGKLATNDNLTLVRG